MVCRAQAHIPGRAESVPELLSGCSNRRGSVCGDAQGYGPLRGNHRAARSWRGAARGLEGDDVATSGYVRDAARTVGCGAAMLGPVRATRPKHYPTVGGLPVGGPNFDDDQRLRERRPRDEERRAQRQRSHQASSDFPAHPFPPIQRGRRRGLVARDGAGDARIHEPLYQTASQRSRRFPRPRRTSPSLARDGTKVPLVASSPARAREVTPGACALPSCSWPLAAQPWRRRTLNRSPTRPTPYLPRLLRTTPTRRSLRRPWSHRTTCTRI